MKYCSNCGSGSAEEAQFCPSCGTRFETEQQPPAQADTQSEEAAYTPPAAQQPPSYEPPPYQQSAPAQSGSNPATLWLILNIVATVLCCLPTGAIGIVFAALGMSAFNNGDDADCASKTKVAKIMFYVSLGAGILTWIAFFVTIAAMGTSIFSAVDYYNGWY